MKVINKDRLIGAGAGFGALFVGYEIWKHFFHHDRHARYALPEHENARGEYGHHHKHHHEHG